MIVYRLDATQFERSRAMKLDNGWLRAPAILTRVGVFEYALPGGKVRRELRLPEEVFAADALASFALVPLTDDHPYSAPGGELTGKNTGSYAVGAVGNPRADAARKFMEGDLLVTDAAAVKRVEEGKRQLSCGYHCSLEQKPGVWTDADGVEFPYDCIQRNIRGNHVAIVSKGRAGPEARVRLDSAEVGVLVSDSALDADGGVDKTLSQGTEKMIKFVIDGVEVEIPQLAANLIAKERKVTLDMVEALKGEVKAAKLEADKSTARADAAEAAVKESKTKLDAATDSTKFAAAVSARVALESKARAILGAEAKLDALSEIDVQKQVIAKLDKTAKLEGKSADYVQARFDAAIDSFEATNPASAAAAKKIEQAKREGRTDDTGKTPVQKYDDAVFSAWSKPAPHRQ